MNNDKPEPVPIYIASGVYGNEGIIQLWEELKAEFPQLELTYNWATQGKAPIGEYPDLSTKEYNGVIEAHILLVVLPGGKGTHFEFGLGVATCPHVILLTTKEMIDEHEGNHTCVFYYLPTVRHAIHDGTWDNKLSTAKEIIRETLGG